MTLREIFQNLIQTYTDDPALPESLWQEIEQHYTHKSRHYHTLAHLEQLLRHLEAVRPDITDWNTVLFSLFYHDIIYSATARDNEEKSAELARKRLESLSVPAPQIAACTAQILATKTHAPSGDRDTDLFTDADLGILGQDWETYLRYSQQVRQEYRIYPDLLYYPGRKKVLHHFLAMARIYKTDYFYERLEARARENLGRELAEMMR